MEHRLLHRITYPQRGDLSTAFVSVASQKIVQSENSLLSEDWELQQEEEMIQKRIAALHERSCTLSYSADARSHDLEQVCHIENEIGELDKRLVSIHARQSAIRRFLERTLRQKEDPSSTFRLQDRISKRLPPS